MNVKALVMRLDAEYVRYRELRKKMNYYRKYGLTDKNSFDFFPLLDEFEILYPKMKNKYGVQLSAKTLNFLNTYIDLI